MRASVLRGGRMVYRDELSDPDRHCKILVLPNL